MNVDRNDSLRSTHYEHDRSTDNSKPENSSFDRMFENNPDHCNNLSILEVILKELH